MFGTRRALLGGNALDPDALEYFARAGVSDGAVTPTFYDKASSFNGSTQYLSIASNSTLQSGAGSFSFAGWVYFNAITTQVYFAKGLGGNATEYEFYIQSSGFSFNIGSGTASSEAKFTTTPVANTWYFVVGWYDSATQLTNIQINNGTVYTGATQIAVPLQSANALNVGSRGGTTFFFNGNMAGWGFWKRKLSANDITTLYNGGIGLTYSGIVSAGLTTNLVSYWALNETTTAASCTRADSFGSNTLTATATGMSASVVSPIATSTASSRQLINSFVKQVKGIGLWSSMVCWPLRSSQNSSSTLTAYSLGGLGVYNGTLSGGLSASNWRSFGMNATTTSGNYITTSLNIPAPLSLVHCGFNGNNQTAISINKYSIDNTSSVEQLSDNSIKVIASISTLYTIEMVMASATVSGGNVTGYIARNGGSFTSATVTQASATTANATLMNNGSILSRAVPQQSFAAVFNQAITNSSTFASFYSIYKSTLGQGLSLT